MEAVRDALRALDEIPDRVARAKALGDVLAEWPDHHSALREKRQEIVKEMRAEQMTYREIGEVLGIHFTRVRQIEGGQRGAKNRPTKKASE
ncbi:sigma factor-like helix-turn-helix DNA-binding protein [Streptomyces microflavus]|uniref:sigma factor-like helix-turn-helix DNA-binding protein n=1 Tax=Streptomyces microflavus TaxID=1919 RepID=UPI0038134EB9